MKFCRFLLVIFFCSYIPVCAQDEARLLKQLNETSEDSLRFYIYRDLGYLFEFEDSTKALHYYREEQKIAEMLSSPLLQSMTQIDFGSVMFNHGDFVSALMHYKTSLKWATIARNCKRKGVALQNIANSFYSTYLYDSAAFYGIKALEAQTECLDTSNMILMCSNLAAYNEDLGLFKESLHYADMGMKLSEESNNFDGYVSAAITASIAARNLKDQVLYKAYLAKAEGKMDQVEHPHYKASLYQNLSGAYFDTEDYKTANRYIDSSLVYLQGNEDNNISASIFMSKGLALHKMGHTLEAIQFLEKALRFAEQKRDWFVVRESHLGLSETNFSLGNLQKAYEHHLSYAQYKDSTQRIESERIVAEISAKYRTEKQQLELSRLQDQAELDAIEKAQAKRQYVFLLIIAILVVLILTTLYALQRRRNTILKQKEAIISEQLKRLETEKQIVVLDSLLKGEETERSRVAKDLHDGVGSLLSGVKLSLSSMDGNMFISADHARIFERSLHQLDDAITEMRRVAQNMMPEILVKSGLITAVNHLANTISQTGSLSIHFEHHNFDLRLPSDMEIIVYRIIQELLQNAVKHSAASEVIIQLSEHDQTINLVVEDNGKGFNPELWDKSTGMGFSNLKNRVNYLKGSIHINTQSGEGSSFLIEFKRKP